MRKALTTTIRSINKEVNINRALPTVIIGERINPTGRKKLQDEIKVGNFETVRSDAIAQVGAGASVLDVNAGVPRTDEKALLVKLIN